MQKRNEAKRAQREVLKLNSATMVQSRLSALSDPGMISGGYSGRKGTAPPPAAGEKMQIIPHGDG